MSDKSYQVGAFPVTEDGKVVLVTTRSGEYWIFPKGCTEKGRSDHAVAGDEAYEEAGLTGVIKRDYYEFKVNSRGTQRLRLFPMKVKKMSKHFPECDERKRIVVSFHKAEKLLQKDLRAALRKMIKIQG
ncbi:MAG: 8-oxo-dGTP pyrophosphatase MutT (NUDIX family) [Lentimonas sp.]|jgi:8-oxo-dGTP pyrophosphatase MutT (NUDIX family)